MTTSFAEANSRLPRQVTGLDYSDPILSIFGVGWSLTLQTPWVGHVGGVALDWEDDCVEDRAWDLVGQTLLQIRETHDHNQPLVEFLFGDAIFRATFEAQPEPWVLRFGDIVIVG